VRKLRSRVSPEEAHARGPVIYAVSKILCGVNVTPTALESEVPVLAEETVKIACFIENCEVLVSVLGTVSVGIPRIAYSRSSGTHPISHAIGRQSVKIPGDIVRVHPLLDFTAPVLSNTAVTK